MENFKLFKVLIEFYLFSETDLRSVDKSIDVSTDLLSHTQYDGNVCA